MFKIELNNDMHVSLKQIAGKSVAYLADSSSGEIISATILDEQKLFEFLQNEFDWDNSGEAMELADLGRKEHRKSAEIIRDYVFGDYDLKSVYKYVPDDVPDYSKDSCANSMLTDALQAAYITLVNQDDVIRSDAQEYTSEYCSNCDSEQIIPADKASLCPECGEIIIPCSMCYNHDKCGGSDYCPFMDTKDYFKLVYDKFWNECMNNARNKLKEEAWDVIEEDEVHHLAKKIFEESADAAQIAGFFITSHRNLALSVWQTVSTGLELSDKHKEVESILTMLYQSAK